MDQLCYNCFLPGHLSIRCTSPSKYTRCYICNRVCATPNDHYSLCVNKQFVSQYIDQPNTARRATLVADLKISTKSPLYVMNGPQPILLDGDFPPIRIDNNYGLLLGKGNNIKYHQWFPTANQRCVINVMNSQNIVRFSVRLHNDGFIVNKKIRIRQNGTVEYRNQPVENEILTADVTFKVDTDRKFTITIFAFQHNYKFEISRDQVEYLPPESASLDCPICYDNMIYTEIRLTPCRHIFCTKCILQALVDKNECPVCREYVCLEELGNIFLHN